MQWHPWEMSLDGHPAPVLTQWFFNRRVEYFPLPHLGKRSKSHVSGSVCSCVFFTPEPHALNSYHCLCHTMPRGLLEELWSTRTMFSKTYWFWSWQFLPSAQFLNVHRQPQWIQPGLGWHLKVAFTLTESHKPNSSYSLEPMSFTGTSFS